MRLKIHVDGLPHEEGAIYVKLMQSEEDSVSIVAVNSRGEEIEDETRPAFGSWLLTLTQNGTVALAPAVFPELGFSQDHNGRIALDPYCEAQAAKHARYDGKSLTRVK